MRRVGAALAAVVTMALAVGTIAAVQSALAGPATAAQPAQDRIVSEVPAAFTPQVKDGQTNAIVQVGTTMLVGGTFTTVTGKSGSPSFPRTGLVAFDAATGAVSTAFNPTLDGAVEALAAGPTAGTVFVGGAFTTVNGVRSKNLALLTVSTGALVDTFRVPGINGLVEDLARSGSRLYLAGRFSSVGNAPHGGIAALDASTGAVDSFLSSTVIGHHNYDGDGAQAAVGVDKLDVSPDGRRLVAIGNFTQVDGLDRDQAAMWDLTATPAVVKPDWHTRRYEPACFDWAFDSYVRDVDFAPDGSYFVVVATGGPNPGTLCDTATRWETEATGDDVQPSWVSDTGGDTLFSVAVTGTAVYVGGHQRWVNNAGGRDAAAPGAVPRPGLAALDPKTGTPFSWNAARHPRGVGAFAIYATEAGIWVGSDTNYIGNFEYWRPRLAFFPLAGGKTVGPGDAGSLPSNVYLGTPTGGAEEAVHYRVNAGGSTVAALDDGPAWVGDDAADSPYRNSGSNTAGWSPGATLTGSVPAVTPAAIFDSERWDPGSAGDGGEMRWSFPEPAGREVEVRLYFANRYPGTSQPGQRVFSVDVDGRRELDHFDIVVDASGDQRAVMKSFQVTSDGSVDIDFAHEVENPLVNGIEIVPVGAAAPPPAETLSRRYVDGGTVSAAADGPTGGPAWSAVRGAVVVDGTLFYGSTDGLLYRRSFDGTAFGAETLVDPYNDAKWSTVQTGSGQTYRGVRPTFYGQLLAVTAFAFAGGRLYYTMTGRTGLYYRLFTPESGIVSPEEFPVPGVSMPPVSGMFVSGESFFFVPQATGELRRRGFTDGAPTGPDTVVSGPGTDGVDWRARVVFLGPGPAPRVNQPPTAAFSQTCDGLSCSFDGSASADPDGRVASYAWNFGDGSTSTESSPSHPYAAAGDYPVRLVVTDDEGATGAVVRTVAVRPAVPIAFRGVGRATAAQTATATVAVPNGAAEGDAQLLLATVSESVTVAAPTGLAGWQLVGRQASGTMSTVVYQRVGAAGDAGRPVTVTTSANTKIILQLGVYSGTSTSTPVAAYAGAADAATASHRTPAATVPASGGWAVSFWADRSSTTTSWTAPAGVTTRDTALPTVSGRVTSLLADSGGPVPAGSYGGLTATTNAASSLGVTMTIVLAPR